MLASLAGIGVAGTLPAPAHAAYVRPYGPGAPWNRPVVGLPVASGSNTLADRLWGGATTTIGDYNCTFYNWTYPVQQVSNATGLYTVKCSYPDWGNMHNKTMPWNPIWKPSYGFWTGNGSADSQLIVLDPASGREWNLWQVKAPDTVNKLVNCSSASLVPGSYWTKEDGFRPPRGCGIQCFAMLVRAQEVAQGVIQHALSMPIRNVAPSYVAPALKSDGRISGGIPEGTRFALRVSDAEIDAWATALPISITGRASARVIAKALRNYGWFITDRSGTAHLQFEDNNSAGSTWSSLGLGMVLAGGKEYPRDLLDGLMRRDRIYAIVPSNQY
jgi:hypothetical protein